MVQQNPLSPATGSSHDGATAVAVGGAVVSIIASTGAIVGGEIVEEDGSVVGDVSGNGAAVGGAEGVTATRVDVGSATAAGTGVSGAGWIDGAGGVTEAAGLGDAGTVAGDGVGAGRGCKGARDQRGNMRSSISRSEAARADCLYRLDQEARRNDIAL